MIRKFFILLVVIFSFLNIVRAEDLNSPVGNWITISDKTHDQSSIVKIWEQNGTLYGKVLKIFPGSNRNPADRCDKCPDKFKGKPVVGLTFLWGFVKKTDSYWGDGEILDPKEGSIYQGTITLIEGGKKLELRGYWTIFWRTQTWIRTSKTA